MKRKIKDYFRYILYKIFKFIFLFTPNFILKFLLIGFARLACKFNREHINVALINLDLVYSNTISNKEKRDIIYQSYKSLFFNIYEFIENQSISKEQLLAKATIINEKVILNAIKNKRKIIFVTAHYGGWELAIPYIALKYGILAVVNRKMDNPYINDMYIKARDKNNIIMLEKSVAAKGMLRAFKNDHFIALAIDQNSKYGIEIDFFDKKVMATDTTARLALKFDALIIPIFAIMEDFRKYTIQVCDAIDVNTFDFKTNDKIKELTQKQASIIEEQILLKPQFWFWQHKRWKFFYTDLYKKGLK